jgi:hypothetical protein
MDTDADLADFLRMHAAACADAGVEPLPEDEGETRQGL